AGFVLGKKAGHGNNEKEQKEHGTHGRKCFETNASKVGKTRQAARRNCVALCRPPAELLLPNLFCQRTDLRLADTNGSS
ncbi:MAG: hypothetical protein KDC43_26355, partial [Saprospiraceae bacterium]|nr:hypothetical protein [Saprospiraceae bacterium]MCB0684183.1 hypothetical protein [Saprospiraceae bacterium]